MNYKLTMLFEDPMTGEVARACIDVSECVGRDIEKIYPPSPFSGDGFDSAIVKMKRRVLRKDLFTDAAKRMGMKLAEMMEDKEGWHGESRQQAYNEYSEGKKNG